MIAPPWLPAPAEAPELEAPAAEAQGCICAKAHSTARLRTSQARPLLLALLANCLKSHPVSSPCPCLPAWAQTQCPLPRHCLPQQVPHPLNMPCPEVTPAFRKPGFPAALLSTASRAKSTSHLTVGAWAAGEQPQEWGTWLFCHLPACRSLFLTLSFLVCNTSRKGALVTCESLE